jgi:hypothetical protein
MSKHTGWLLLVALLGLVGPGEVPADIVKLQNGGELRGVLDAGHSRDPQITIRTLTGGTVVLTRDAVLFTSTRSIETEEYETRSRALEGADVAARWELAEWCRQNRLRSQRAEQLELILLQEPDHEAAHKGLGHVVDRGEWVTREVQMERRGYTLHEGKWVTRQELDLLEKTEAQRELEQEWFVRIHTLERWLTGRNERQRVAGEIELRGITDPAAIPALVKHLANHELSDVRGLCVEVLGAIPGPAPVFALVQRTLFDNNSFIRDAARKALKPDQHETAVGYLVQGLTHNDNAVVNRAGSALGDIADRRAIPALIEALVTNHSYTVDVPVAGPINVGAVTPGATLADPSIVSQYLPPEVEAQLRTGQLPFGAVVLPPSGVPRRYKRIRVNTQLQNPDVLAALEKLSGQHFDFDERTWRLWWAAEGQHGATAS